MNKRRRKKYLKAIGSYHTVSLKDPLAVDVKGYIRKMNAILHKKMANSQHQKKLQDMYRQMALTGTGFMVIERDDVYGKSPIPDFLQGVENE